MCLSDGDCSTADTGPVSQSGDGAHLSGLGYREGSMAWSVPRAENSCWNDEPKPQCRRVNFMGSVVHVPSQEAFLLHEACWSLLRRVYGQKAVPLARLLNVCKSLCSLSCTRINWGHSYGGMLDISGRGGLHYSVTRRHETWRPMIQNPFPDVNRTWTLALQRATRPKGSVNRKASKPCPIKRAKSRSEGVSCLDRLPLDIWIEICAYLKVHDCLQLRFISRRLSTFMQSSHFWTLKIKSEEFEFAFELHELEPSKFDNARLLHRLICIQRATSLHNRARIWGLARCLKGILDLSEPDTTTMVNNPSDPVGLDWVKLRWSIKPPNSGQEYAKGCQILYTQRVILTGHLRQITVSSIDMEDTVYITGLKLSFDDGTSTQLGYRSQDNSSTDVVAFGGFVVAVGTTGIHGLQIIDNRSDSTKWFGSNRRCPQTRKLKSEKEIVGIKAFFDVSILSGLASCLRPELMAG